MSNEMLLFIFLVTVILAALDVTRRAIISIIVSRNDDAIRVAMRRLRKPIQPHVTVLIYSKNQAKNLERTVRQVRQSRYSSFDIVAISDRSTDETATHFKRYLTTLNGRIRVQFLQRRIVGTKMNAYQAAYQKSERGTIVVLLDAGQHVDRQLIKRAVVSKSDTDKRWRVVIEQNKSQQGVRGIAEGLQAFLWNRPITAEVCRPNVLRKNNIRQLQNNSKWLFFTLQILLVCLIIAGSIYGGIIALWYAWVVFSAYLLALIWIHFNTPIQKKWKYIYSVPSALFLIPVVELAEGITQLRIRK